MTTKIDELPVGIRNKHRRTDTDPNRRTGRTHQMKRFRAYIGSLLFSLALTVAGKRVRIRYGKRATVITIDHATRPENKTQNKH